MELDLSDFHIDDIQWGDRTSLARGQLSLNLSEIQDQIKDLTRNINVTAELARPGESKRIVHVLDTALILLSAALKILQPQVDAPTVF